MVFVQFESIAKNEFRLIVCPRVEESRSGFYLKALHPPTLQKSRRLATQIWSAAIWTIFNILKLNLRTKLDLTRKLLTNVSL